MNQTVEKSRIETIIADSESLMIFGIIVVVTIITATVLGRYFHKKLREEAKKQNANITLFSFIKHSIKATIYFFGFGWALLSLPISATFAHSLFAGAGASSLILGFASHQVFNNLMSGILLIMRKPFKINDVVEFEGYSGKVVDLNLHDTIIEDEKNNIIIIPNGLISSGVIKNLRK